MNYKKDKKVLFFSSYWGYQSIPIEDFLIKIKNAGYDGIEINFVTWPKIDVNKLFKLAEELELNLISQVAGFRDKDFDSYKKQYLSNVEYQASLNPCFINCYTDKRFFRQQMEC